MTEPAYLALDDDEQVEALRPGALEAAARFGLEVTRMEVVAHAYNTTFGVDTAGGRRVALRLNTNSQSAGAEVVAQQAWQVAIAAETSVVVPEPLVTTTGEWFAEVACEPLGRPLVVTAASWLAGDDVGVDLPLNVARELGRVMALLHRQAADWTLPPAGRMPTFDDALFGDPDLLHSAPGLEAEGGDVVERSRAATAEAFARVHDDALVRALHADLHGGNLKWEDGHLAVFDFDDCGLGVPALDLAVAAFYLRDGDPAPEAAMRAGYADVVPLPEIDPADHDALIAARQLLLLNSLLTTSTAELRAEAAGYAQVSVDRLRHWLTTGTFTRSIDGSSPDRTVP